MTRYDRNIAVKEVGKQGQRAISAAKVLVFGAGGLGSTVISALCGLGVGKIGIVDFDKVEISNLNRQFLHTEKSIENCELKAVSAKNWVEKFNSGIEVESFPVKLSMDNYPEIVRKYDILVDCFDSFESKFLLNDIAVKTGKTLIHGGVTGFRGQVTTIIPKKTGCLRCLFPESGDETIEKGVVSPAVSLVGSVQALEVLKLILGREDILSGKILFIDMLKMNFHTAVFEPRNTCSCGNSAF